jgi:hypothetical protein
VLYSLHRMSILGVSQSQSQSSDITLLAALEVDDDIAMALSLN